MTNETPATDSRLFGVPGAEILYTTIVGCYEACVDVYGEDDKHRAAHTIEEWTVRQPKSHLPSALGLVEWIGEHAAVNDTSEEWSDDFADNASRDPDVLAAADALLRLIASKISYRMADKRIAVHTVTWNDDLEPLVDGESLHEWQVKPERVPA